jgi:hypothetical protein
MVCLEIRWLSLIVDTACGTLTLSLSRFLSRLIMSFRRTLVSSTSTTTKQSTTRGHVLDMLADAWTETVVLPDRCLRSGL